jgi:hypothetical protein
VGAFRKRSFRVLRADLGPREACPRRAVKSSCRGDTVGETITGGGWHVDREAHENGADCGLTAAVIACVPALAQLSVPPPQIQSHEGDPGTLGDPASWRTPEFLRDNGMISIGAEFAYAAGYAGTGMNIGIVDPASLPATCASTAAAPRITRSAIAITRW